MYFTQKEDIIKTETGVLINKGRKLQKKHCNKNICIINKNNEKKKDGGFMLKLSTFIVDKRNLFFLIFIIPIIKNGIITVTIDTVIEIFLSFAFFLLFEIIKLVISNIIVTTDTGVTIIKFQPVSTTKTNGRKCIISLAI